MFYFTNQTEIILEENEQHIQPLYGVLVKNWANLSTFFSSDDRPQLEIVRIWSNAITIYWTVLIEVESFRVEYRKVNDSEWFISDILNGGRRLYSLIDLESETGYELLLVMKRAGGGSIATTVPVTVMTCQRGFSGENCSQGKKQKKNKILIVFI